MATDPGWVYALSYVLHDNPIVKVGHTCWQHPGRRAIRVAYGNPAFPHHLWASRSADIGRDEAAAHKALAGFRYHEMRRIEGRDLRRHRWANVGGRELFVCAIPTALDVLAEVTGNRPHHFPNWLEEIEPYIDFDDARKVRDLLTGSAAVLAGDPSKRLDYQAILRDWREFPCGPRTSGELVVLHTQRAARVPWRTSQSSADILTFPAQSFLLANPDPAL